MRTRRLFPSVISTSIVSSSSSASTSTSLFMTTTNTSTALRGCAAASSSASTTTAAAAFDSASSESIVASILGGATDSSSTSNNKTSSPELIRVLLAANNLASIKGNLITDATNLQSASRVFAAISDQLEKVPVIILTRLLSKKWSANILPTELEMRMRREVYNRCGDLRKGDEIAEVLIRWSIRPDHAADLGMFRKLGKLLAYHITTVDSSINLLQALRSLRRARIKPPPQFLEIVSRRMVVLLSRGVDFANKTENHQNEYDEENGDFTCKDAVQVLRLFQDFYGTSETAKPLAASEAQQHNKSNNNGNGNVGIPLPLVIGCVRIAAARIEKRLLDLNVISAVDAPDLLNEGIAASAKEAVAAKKSTTTTSAGENKTEETAATSEEQQSTTTTATATTKALTSRDASKILAKENLTPLQLIFLLTHMTNNRITTLKYTRPFALLLGGLVTSTAPAAATPSSPFRISHRDFVSLLVPTLARFPIQRFAGCNEVSADWSHLLIKQLNTKLRICSWEELLYASQFVTNYIERRQSEIDNTLSEAEREALAKNSGLSVGDTDRNIVVPFFDHIAQSLQPNDTTRRTAPTSWQSVLLARWMQRASKADPENLEKIMKEKFFPPIINRCRDHMEKGLIPLNHYEHLMETLTHANCHQTPEAEKIRELRKTITEDPKPYRERCEGFSLWKPLRSFNESNHFGDMPDAADRELLRKFTGRDLMPRHPLYLLKVLHEFDTSFPNVLQPAIRREFAYVFERQLLDEKACSKKYFVAEQQKNSSTSEEKKSPVVEAVGSSSGSNSSTSASDTTTTSEDGKQQLREFVDLFWKAAPTTCKTSKVIWKALSKQAERLGDEELAKKTVQIHKLLDRLKL